MAEHNDVGKWGEQLARQYLEAQGYAILQCNYRCGKHEVDIIAYLEGVVVFVEVKTRKNNEYGEPEDFVLSAKQRAYIRMANDYVVKNNRDDEVRFDIIAITFSSSDYSLNHIPNAFSACDLN